MGHCTTTQETNVQYLFISFLTRSINQIGNVMARHRQKHTIQCPRGQRLSNSVCNYDQFNIQKKHSKSVIYFS